MAVKVFEELLGLGECWEVKGANYEEDNNSICAFVLVVEETEKLVS